MKKRSEILKKKWINVEILKIHIPENMEAMIEKKYKVEVNDDSIQAKDSIIGKPIYDNFKTYSGKRLKNRSVHHNGAPYITDYGVHAQSVGIDPHKCSVRQKSSKANSSGNFRLARIDSSINVSVGKGGKTSKSKKS